MEKLFTALLSLLTVISLFLLIIGFFNPSTSLFWYKKERTKKLSLLIYGLSLIIFLFVGGTLSDSKKINASVDQNTLSENEKADSVKNDNTKKIIVDTSSNNGTALSASINQKQPAIVGQTYNLGTLTYKIDDFKFKRFVGGLLTLKKAHGKFLIVTLTVNNHGKEQVLFDNSFFKLTDDSGAIYDYSPDATASIELSYISGHTFLGMTINPNITKTGKVVFEVPSSDKNYHLILDDWNSEQKLVIPLKE